MGCGIVSNLDGLAGTTITSKYSQPDAEDMEIGKVEDDRKCFNCDKRGHLAAKCPKRGNKGTKREGGGKDGIVCHYCDKPGHKRPDCRKLKRDEKEGKVDPKAKGRRRLQRLGKVRVRGTLSHLRAGFSDVGGTRPPEQQHAHTVQIKMNTISKVYSDRKEGHHLPVMNESAEEQCQIPGPLAVA